ncbi:MAG: pseudaminic acid synthase [Kiloniellales bacterium]|nr:pseudaminic acid synthase [Kiloniellales bacterium]
MTASGRTIEIAGRGIGPDFPPFVIAELSANHAGDLNRALAMIEAAKEAGADAAKLQTYRPDTITIDHDGPGFLVEEGLWAGRRLFELYEEAQTPWDWHETLFEKAKDVGITLFSAPFDQTAVDLLESLNTPAYKIASFEIVDLPLVEYAATTGKPLIISTGMASRQEIAEALSTAKTAGAEGVALLHCISGYPTPLSEANLRMISELRQRFAVPVGLSDHTHGLVAACAAVSLGASIVEKHFTLSRDKGLDAAFSLEPDELKHLVRSCRETWEALGEVAYGAAPSEAQSLKHRRSLYVVADMAAGEVFTSANLRSIRPGGGVSPKHLPDLLGRRAKVDILKGTPMSWDLAEDPESRHLPSQAGTQRDSK